MHYVQKNIQSNRLYQILMYACVHKLDWLQTIQALYPNLLTHPTHQPKHLLISINKCLQAVEREANLVLPIKSNIFYWLISKPYTEKIEFLGYN